jgi:GNAT superfamily N-acetyltransferase
VQGDAKVEVRELRSEDELRAAFDVVRQLRDHLDLDTFLDRHRRQAARGYVLQGAFTPDGTLVGVIGMRPVTTLARGDHLHVDDLVVTRGARGRGYGKHLMVFAEDWARAHKLGTVFLDSRPEVLEFYGRLGYTSHTATLVRKKLGS